MGKELTNRQLAEALAYALERAEKNINQSVSKLESERKRIEEFRIDTESSERLFKDANLALNKTAKELVLDLEKMRKTKPKSVEIKEWILYGFMILCTFGSLVFGGYQLSMRSGIEKQNAQMQETFEHLQKFFQENPKEKETFEKWNK
jgi:hypothetical protein